MKPKILAAIVGAIAEYIREEESAQIASGYEPSSWRFWGKQAQINYRINTGQVRPRPGKGVWKYCGLDRMMATRIR